MISPTARRLAAVLVAAVLGAACAAQQENSTGLLRPVQREILNLSLGESPRQVRRDYPGFSSCPVQDELSGVAKRAHMSAACVKAMPQSVRDLWLGFEDGRLVEIQVIYNEAFTREKPADALAGDVALIYGPPQHTQGKSWWADADTVLRVFYAEVSDNAGEPGAVSLRTSFQLVNASLFRK